MGVKLCFSLEDPQLWDGMDFKHVMRFLSHKVIFESISSNGQISSLVSILKHGTKEDIMNVPWILKYLVLDMKRSHYNLLHRWEWRKWLKETNYGRKESNYGRTYGSHVQWWNFG
jgi:hypothetical protein